MTFDDYESSWEARQNRATLRARAVGVAALAARPLLPIKVQKGRHPVEDVGLTAYQKKRLRSTRRKTIWNQRPVVTTTMVAQPTASAELLKEQMGRDAANIPIMKGYGPVGAGGKAALVENIFKWTGVAWMLAEMGLPEKAAQLLGGTGETLGLPNAFGRFGSILNDVHVAVYYRDKLIGTMELGNWTKFRNSMKRSVKANMRAM